MKIIGATIGNCVHNAGLLRFLDKARSLGHEAAFGGICLPVEKIIELSKEGGADLIALSYRLTPEVARDIFRALEKGLEGLAEKPLFAFGGTGSVCRIAREFSFFRFVVSGSDGSDELDRFLRGAGTAEGKKTRPPDNLSARIKACAPFPLLRHHFGRPSLSATVAGARKIAEAGVLDILSVGPDQNAQEFFFEPERMDPRLTGGGGVPVRRARDLEAIYRATRRGNYPLVRCYSGTNHLVEWARLLKETINICFGAVPLTFYSEIDGRSKRKLLEAIVENQRAIAWYGEHGIPVEVNESHQWALRGADPAVEIAAARLGALNARKLGVTEYVQQFMFNVPREITPVEDLAKMLAKRRLVEELEDGSFTVRRMVRTGLDSLPADYALARGHIASSLTVAMFLEPQIVHVVGYSEADHVIGARELIESVKIARGALEYCFRGLPAARDFPEVSKRAGQLYGEARACLERVEKMGDPASADVIERAVREGVLNAPQVIGHLP